LTQHTILFLPANPTSIDPRELDVEAHAIQEELAQSGHRDLFTFVTRWAVEPLDVVLRELRRLKPTVVHFSSGQRGVEQGALREPLPTSAACSGTIRLGGKLGQVDVGTPCTLM
jgi:hypothetical protein